MATLSITLIGHNEAPLLERALESARGLADELVYVDCESTDNSLEVARRHSARIFQQPNTTNLNVNKQYGIDQCTGDWIFYLDPDEVLPAELAREIRQVVDGSTPHAAFTLPRRNIFFGRWLRHGGQYPDRQLRLFRRGQARFPCRHVHERLEVDGSTGALRHGMEHHTCATPMDAIRKMDWFSSFNARQMAASGLRPGPLPAFRFIVQKPLSRFWRRWLFKGGFRDGWPGFIVAFVDSVDLPFRYFKFWYLATHPEAAAPDAAPAGAPPPPPAPPETQP